MTLKILVIDDDVVDRMAVNRGLRLAEVALSVEEIDSAARGLDALIAGAYDCVFLDYLLPDGDGLDLVRKARQRGVLTPIVILTGQGDEEIAVELMKAGASDYLPKGLATPERICQTFRTLVRLHEAESHAARAEAERDRLLALEQEARADAEAAHGRLGFLAESSIALADSLDISLTVDTVAGLAVPAIADWCLVELADRGGLVRGLARRYDGEIRRFVRDRAERERPMPRVGRLLTPDEALAEIPFGDAHLDLLKGRSLNSALIVPLIARGRAIGAITLGVTRPHRPFAQDELAFAEELARRAAIAVDNARLYEEAREASGRLRHQLDITRAITNSLAEGVCALDLEGRITFLNPTAEALLRWRSEDAIGRDLHDIVHAGETNQDRCVLRDAFGVGRLVRSESDTFRRCDGGTFLVSYAASPITSDGRVVGTALAFHDITERRRAEEELERSRRQMAMSEKLSALGTLVSGVAHELRTPLTYVANNVFLVRHRLQRAAEMHPELAETLHDVTRFSTEAMDGVDRINALVKDLRPFVNPEPGIRQLLGLHDVVGTAVELFRATHKGRATVQADLKPTPPLPIDKGQIQRVIINLLLNAVEAMPSGGSVHVETLVVDGGAEIRVRDEGKGLSPQVQARIFDPFFTTKSEGTGLGLSITRGLVEAHGGTIRFVTQLGEGTTFFVFLPGTSERSVQQIADATLQVS